MLYLSLQEIEADRRKAEQHGSMVSLKVTTPPATTGKPDKMKVWRLKLCAFPNNI